MTNLYRLFASVLLILGVAGCQISGDLRDADGFADLGDSYLMDARRDVSISLGPMPLRLARLLVDDDEGGDILADLDAVRVHVYTIDRGTSTHEQLTRASHQLERGGWESLVKVRGEDAEHTQVLVRPNRRGHIAGLVVLSLDHDELVVINLIGDIRPERFSQYMDGLDIDGPQVAIDAG